MSILKGYAREQAYFKVEQEADILRHKQRLEKEGRLGEQLGKIEGNGDDSPGAAALRASEESYQVPHRRRSPLTSCMPAAALRHPLTRRRPSLSTQAQVLAEVHQQRVRIDDPHALTRRQFERRVKAQAPELTEEERLRYGQRSALGETRATAAPADCRRSSCGEPQGPRRDPF